MMWEQLKLMPTPFSAIIGNSYLHGCVAWKENKHTGPGILISVNGDYLCLPGLLQPLRPLENMLKRIEGPSRAARLCAGSGEGYCDRGEIK